MTLNKFIQKNSATWNHLEETIKNLKAKGIKKVHKNDINNLLSLYNISCGHLSYSRTFYGNCDLTTYLNNLVSQAHGYIYTTKSARLTAFFEFILRSFPISIYKNLKYLGLSTLAFAFGFGISFIYTMISKDYAATFLPRQVLESVDFNSQDRTMWDSPVMSSFILTNNIKVGFYAFSLGITLGIGTLYVLATNGFLLGSLSALALQSNYSYTFWSLILPHGIIELFAIFVCGAAGLMLGHSIIVPGIYSRKDSLILKSKTAIKIVLGTIPLFIVAGIIEGYITPSGMVEAYKYLFAIFTLLILVIYITVPNYRKG